MILLLSCESNKPTLKFQTIGMASAKAQAQSEGKAIFLFVYQDEANPYVKVFQEQIFKDQAIADYFNAHFVNVSLDAKAQQNWCNLAENYGVYQSPTLLLLTPQAEVIAEISELGALGYDAEGNLPCRSQMLRIARVAAAYGQSSDSAFFSKENWQDLNQINMRLDSKLFARVASNKNYLRSLYGNEWDMMMDFNMASASLRLMIYEKDKAARCNDFRVKAYYAALEAYDFPLKERYRLYADVNIAYGLGDIVKARQVAYQAYKDGVIQEMEYLQLYDKL